VAPAQITCIPNGAFLGPLQDRADRPVADAPGAPIFLYAGAHGPANGLEQVLSVAEILAARREAASFHLVGEGPEKPSLQERAFNAGLTNVTFIVPVPKSKMLEVLQSADCGLHILADVDLFRHACSPNKVVDYMAAALPVITNTPGEVGNMGDPGRGGPRVRPAESASRAAVARPGVLRGDRARAGHHQHAAGRGHGDQPGSLRAVTLHTRDAAEVLRWAERGRSNHFEGKPGLLELAVDGLGRCSPPARGYWLDRLASLSRDDWATTIERVPRPLMSQVDRTFASAIIERNRERLLDA
jgi:hypothetical protein